MYFIHKYGSKLYTDARHKACILQYIAYTPHWFDNCGNRYDFTPQLYFLRIEFSMPINIPVISTEALLHIHYACCCIKGY